ncbi:flagellar basal-body MS-ring/collar protein FliF [Niallia taxi]|uniref:flagellar basal-body MS-ring/collar protein FliF n=1 Tax=Niallia taxi TaxID=2499688 RepID=UPI001247B396|nr:flagellar basal-body MS-ring/collar protein FliF [Niallia taxi]MCM3214750.1 flagellar M-ring protein FliF [Niallia taxi]MDK8638651.1 flagellar basal-body MS-ring/collar protein FliF [Niallia taxi]MED4053727.1 flagellar basal-body MS-ring/collar protein FliF [Niallia taxi]MED4119567.1 flagellar basal-body MS-ring/collar protein FliF [Niallia taxi]
MKENMNKFFNPLKEYWTNRSKKQKTVLVSGILLLLLMVSFATYFLTKENLVPLYSNLSPSETGQIKETLDSKGITSEISDGGKTISVPENVVDSLKVELAAEGIPNTGSIDYSFFSQNASFGMTDNEFNVMKLDAMQTEISNLIKGIDGINDANVMITLPSEGVFVSDEAGEASASIVLNTKPGYNFSESQIKGLYTLVAKSVPNLPTDNIVITNQNFEYFDLNSTTNNAGDTFTAQNNVKKQVEKDIQRQVQQMLGTLMGQNKVMVSVTADIDFTQENREENLVTPVDEENMKGIEVSAQNISETYTGGSAAAEGTPAAEDQADTTTTNTETTTSGSGDSEKIDNTINYEVNRIKKQIVESPYKIRDLGIQVMVEPPTADDPSSLSQDSVDDITNMLGTIVRTSIDKTETGTLSDADLQSKIAVSVQQFNGKTTASSETASTSIPWWVYAVGGVLLAVIGLLIFLFVRGRKKKAAEPEEEIISPVSIPDVNDEVESEGTLRRKQLEKMAKDKPEDFAKLLRTWITEE